jgi:hypothetical protein
MRTVKACIHSWHRIEHKQERLHIDIGFSICACTHFASINESKVLVIAARHLKYDTLNCIWTFIKRLYAYINVRTVSKYVQFLV